jgi:hypothetical protein
LATRTSEADTRKGTRKVDGSREISPHVSG